MLKDWKTDREKKEKNLSFWQQPGFMLHSNGHETGNMDLHLILGNSLFILSFMPFCKLESNTL